MIARAARSACPSLAALRPGVGALALLCAACATVASSPPLRFERPIVLLGEVHDNAAQHALRLDALRASLAAGARPALAMEQLDRDRQDAIDRLRAQDPPADADAVIAAAGERGWDWSFYRPYIALALQYRLPIVAAGVSRKSARQVMRDGLAASGFDPAVPPAVLHALASDIEGSHCGMLDDATAQRMALAQVARDQTMARVVENEAARGVVLLAGNGHVRTDVGAPRWLDAATRARSEAIGVLERGDDASPYDRVVVTAPQPRADPCAGMRATGAKPAS